MATGSSPSDKNQTDQQRAAHVVASAGELPYRDHFKTTVEQPHPWFGKAPAVVLLRAIEAQKPLEAKALLGEKPDPKQAESEEKHMRTRLAKLVKGLKPEEREAAMDALVKTVTAQAHAEAAKDHQQVVDKEVGLLTKQLKPQIDALAAVRKTEKPDAKEIARLEKEIADKTTTALKGKKGMDADAIAKRITATSPEEAKRAAAEHATSFEKATAQAQHVVGQVGKEIAAAPGALVKDAMTSAITGLPPGTATAVNFTRKITGI